MSAKAKDKKELKELMRAGKLIANFGYLKDAARFAGDILYEHFDLVLEYLSHRDKTVLLDLASLVSPSERLLLFRYASAFFPIEISGNSVRVLPIVDADAIRARRVLIDFDTFKRLFELGVDVTVEQLEVVSSQLSSMHSDWRRMLSSFSRWPSTDAPPSLAHLLEDGWLKAGMLSYFGYHVGQQGLSVSRRLPILERLLKADLDDKAFDQVYVKEWGRPASHKRLMKMARTIAALCRNAKRSPSNFDQAISDWESDLKYLHDHHYIRGLNLPGDEWPET